VWQILRQIEAEESAVLRVVMCSGAAEHGLHQQQCRDDEEIPRRASLCGCQQNFSGWTESQRSIFGRVPAELAWVSAEERQQQSGSAEKRDDGERAPDDRLLGRVIPDKRIRRPIVGVRVRLSGTP